VRSTSSEIESGRDGALGYPCSLDTRITLATFPGPLQEYLNLNDPLLGQLLNGIDAIYDRKEFDHMASAKDPINGTTTTALYFADLNKPMTEFFKTKILGDKEKSPDVRQGWEPHFVQLKLLLGLCAALHGAS
jgi:hypothetical protein